VCEVVLVPCLTPTPLSLPRGPTPFFICICFTRASASVMPGPSEGRLTLFSPLLLFPCFFFFSTVRRTLSSKSRTRERYRQTSTSQTLNSGQLISPIAYWFWWLPCPVALSFSPFFPFPPYPSCLFVLLIHCSIPNSIDTLELANDPTRKCFML